MVAVSFFHYISDVPGTGGQLDLHTRQQVGRELLGFGHKPQPDLGLMGPSGNSGKMTTKNETVRLGKTRCYNSPHENLQSLSSCRIL